MKTRVITAVVGLAVLALVMFAFNTVVFNLIVCAITIVAIHEVYSAVGFGKKELPLFLVLIPYTLLIMLSHTPVVREWCCRARLSFWCFMPSIWW